MIATVLFTIFIAVILHIAQDDVSSGIEISNCIDGRFFNLARFKTKTKATSNSLMEFQYANDSCVAALREDHLQQILNVFHLAYTKFGLRINIKKTLRKVTRKIF